MGWQRYSGLAHCDRVPHARRFRLIQLPGRHRGQPDRGLLWAGRSGLLKPTARSAVAADLENERRQLVECVSKLQSDENESCDHQISAGMHESLKPIAFLNEWDLREAWTAVNTAAA